ncbi:MAG: cation-translocating P-type ATPase [Clostridia bacterium]|nr:cation-translocating P-type ATPase [Clostridia bacterium]
MLKNIIEKFESVLFTIISGISLVLSFILSKTTDGLFFDPAIIAVIISGTPIFYSAVKKLLKNKGISKISSALLISVAMLASVFIGDLFAAGEVAFIMAIGEILEDKTTAKAKKGLKNLLNLAPAMARIILPDGTAKETVAENVAEGDLVRVLPGETIPVDGIIVNGETSVDQSVMTGESVPVDKSVNDSVFCGTINRFGSVDIKATNVGENSSLKKMIKMVKEAESKKAPMARIADKGASFLVPIAFLIAVITGLVTKDITRAVTILVVFCPCALVLATPTAIMAAIGQGTKNGIIIKSGEALEKMGKADTITFDKTGTLTYGKLEVSDVLVFSDTISEADLLKTVASAESKSEHPLAKAIVDFAEEKNIQLSEADDFRMLSGMGISAGINGKNIICGNESFLNKNGIIIDSEISTELSKLRSQGKASVIVAEDNVITGVIALSDVLRENACEVIIKLDKMNTRTVLLTGDNRLTAEYFAQKAGIKNVKYELLPENKVENIKLLQNEGRTVCMIGDGVNDAPALKTADIGISMGSIGSDIAIDASDIALMSDDISKIPYLKKLACAAVRTIKLSISISMIIYILAVILSVSGLLTPTSGALVHNAGSVFVILFAAMLYDKKLK